MDGNFWQNFEKFKLPIALSLLGLVLIIGGIFTSGLNKSAGWRTTDYPKESLVQSKVISVDVSGAVARPGVYQLKEGSRMEEAIAAAGGFAEKVNGEYISKYLNMAQRLSDGSKIYIPFVGESLSGSESTGALVGTQAQTKVNINTASLSELETLPGIGSVTASKIISERPYQEIGELLNKKIVGKATFEKIKDLIVLY